MAKSRRTPSLMRKARKTSSGKILALGIILAALAYVFASSTASFNPTSLLAAVSGTATTTTSLKVVSPNGGEVWAKGSTQTIKWSGGASTWKLEVLLKNASTTNTVATIATSTANTGSISWKVPTTVKARTYNIRIRCTNCPTGAKGVTDLSDKPFAITDVVAQPDLIATSVLPAAAMAGVPVRFVATTTNIGNASTGSGFGVAFQTATSTAGSGAAVIGATQTTALAAGSARQVPLTYTFSAPGTYYVRACADFSPIGIAFGGSEYSSLGSGSITESNENNNCGPYTAVVVNAAATSTAISAEVTGAGTTRVDDSQATFSLRYKVTAQGGPIYIPAQASSSVIYTMQRNGVSVSAIASSTLNTNRGAAIPTSNGNYRLEAGQTLDFSLDVLAVAWPGDGYYRLVLTGLKWGIADDRVAENTGSVGFVTGQINLQAP